MNLELRQRDFPSYVQPAATVQAQVAAAAAEVRAYSAEILRECQLDEENCASFAFLHQEMIGAFERMIELPAKDEPDIATKSSVLDEIECWFDANDLLPYRMRVATEAAILRGGRFGSWAGNLRVWMMGVLGAGAIGAIILHS